MQGAAVTVLQARLDRLAVREAPLQVNAAAASEEVAETVVVEVVEPVAFPRVSFG
jgi:hypothetical protein